MSPAVLETAAVISTADAIFISVYFTEADTFSAQVSLTSSSVGSSEKNLVNELIFLIFYCVVQDHCTNLKLSVDVCVVSRLSIYI